MAKRLVSTSKIRRAAAVAAVLAAASGLAVYAGASGAGAAPAPTIAQVQAEVNSLQARVDKVGQQYDAVGQEVASAQARLAEVSKQTARAEDRYHAAQTALRGVAIAAYENSNNTSILGLLTSGNPAAVLNQASLILQVAGTNNAEASQFLIAARELAAIRAQRQRTEDGVAQLRAQLAAQKSSLAKLLAGRTAVLDSLTAAQQAQVTASTVGGTPTGGTAPPPYTGPTATQADKAVAFAYAQIGKPYLWGGTGPDAYDCSGLVQAAWAAAGVSIPRTTYEQWAALPQVPMSDLQPGDLILYNGESHVAMYVGGGYIIDAPSTGYNVERIPEDTSWYAANADGAVRP